MFKLTSRPFSRWNKNCYACVCACAYACVPSENQALASRHAIINTIPIPVILRVLKHLCLGSLMSLSLPRGFSFQFSSHGMTKRLNGLRRQRLTCTREQSAHMREEPGWPWRNFSLCLVKNLSNTSSFSSLGLLTFWDERFQIMFTKEVARAIKPANDVFRKRPSRMVWKVNVSVDCKPFHLFVYI